MTSDNARRMCYRTGRLPRRTASFGIARGLWLLLPRGDALGGKRRDSANVVGVRRRRPADPAERPGPLIPPQLPPGGVRVAYGIPSDRYAGVFGGRCTPGEAACRLGFVIGASCVGQGAALLYVRLGECVARCGDRHRRAGAVPGVGVERGSAWPGWRRGSHRGRGGSACIDSGGCGQAALSAWCTVVSSCWISKGLYSRA
jgi:hypothetical protein